MPNDFEGILGIEALDAHLDEVKRVWAEDELRLLLRQVRTIYTEASNRLHRLEVFEDGDPGVEESRRACRRVRSAADARIEWTESVMRRKGMQIPNPRWKRR